MDSGLERQRSDEGMGRAVAFVSVAIGIGLSVAKIVIGLRAHSHAVVSDGIEAAGDVLSSVIVFTGLWIASKPPDEDHPYGHGRYETLAGLAVGGLLLLTGAAILWHGITSPAEAQIIRGFAIYPLLVAIVLKVGLAFTKLRVGRRIESSALLADAWHDLTDLLSTCIALVSVGLSLMSPVRLGNADRAGGIAIGLIVLFLSGKVVRRTVVSLVNTMPDPARMREIREAAIAVPGALGIEKCFARRTGLKYHVDLHLEVDPEMSVRESHEVATRVKQTIKSRLNWVADVLIHVEPTDMAAQAKARTATG